MAWNLSPGDVVVRKQLHERYGGQRQGGIATPSDNILIFTDPSTGEQHDYHDRWVTTPTGSTELHYAGEGQPQHGDQQMQRGNKAILEHRETERPIRVFYGSKGTVEYAGEFELANDGEPDHYVERVDSADGGSRTVIMFRLVPVGRLRRDADRQNRPLVVAPQPLTTPYRTANVAAGETRVPFSVDPDAIDRGLQGHVDTQNALRNAAKSAGLETLSPGPGDPNFDLAWRRPDGSVVVVEVKSLTPSNQASQIRLGLGQVLDYTYELRKLGNEVTPVLAVETKPTSDRWVDVCGSVGVELVWPSRFQRVL